MPKYKLRQFKEFEAFENTHEFPRENKGRWNEVFENENPIVLELACGYGHYATELGKRNPNINYIGIDRKGNRMWHGAKECVENGIGNVRFIRSPIELLEEYFSENEISEIWITFPDPQLKDRQAKNRLTHPNFLKRYSHFLKPNGIIHLKTDSDLLYAFTKYTISDCQLPLHVDHADIYAWKERPSALDIHTYYEKKWLKEGKKIKYLQFQLKSNAFNHINDFRKYGVQETNHLIPLG